MKIKQTDLPKLLSPIADALAYEGNSSREELFDRYMAEPYENDDKLKSRKKSTFKTTEISDVVEAIFAEAMEVFSADDAIVEFAPASQEDVDAARQETMVINHLFKEQNESFTVLATWFKEGLIEQNAYVRSGWVEKSRVTIEEYEDLTPEQFFEVYAKAQQAESYDVEELTGAQVLDDGTLQAEIGADGQPSLISVRIRCEATEKKYEIEPIPQSEFFISPRWNKVSLDGCPAYGHKAQKTKSQLLAMGFDADSLESVQEGDDDQGKINRHTTEQNDDGNNQEDDLMTVCEAYVTTDNGDTPRLLKCWTTEDGRKLLKWEDGSDAIEEVERGPFSAWTPYIVPHRHVGRSVAEMAMARQNLQTNLFRHLLDNMSATNNVRPIVDTTSATEDTYNDLMDPRPGAPIRTAGVGGVSYSVPPQIIGDVLAVMDRVDGDLEKHAGAVRYAQGLGPNTLEKTNIGSQGVGRIMDAAQRRMAVVVRTFAETGLRDLFLRMHADMRRGPAREIAMQIAGEWVTTSPIKWPERTDMVVRVGSGRGDKEKRLTALQSVLAEQKELLLAGSPIVTMQHIFETYKRMARLLGLQSVEPFMQDPATIEPPAPPDPMSDPNMVLAMAENTKAQAAVLQAQTDQGEAMADIEFRERKLQLERDIAEFKAREAEAQLQLKAQEVGIKAVQAIS